MSEYDTLATENQQRPQSRCPSWECWWFLGLGLGVERLLQEAKLVTGSFTHSHATVINEPRVLSVPRSADLLIRPSRVVDGEPD